MNYYKLISNSAFIGVATSYDFRCYQKKHKILLACDENTAQYIQIGEKLYHDSWLCPVKTDMVQYAEAQIISIEKEEYELLFEATEKGEEIPSPPEDDSRDYSKIQTDPIEEITVAYAQQQKINELTQAYSEAIAKGVDVVINGRQIHYTLTPQDQLNLIALADLANAGEKNLPYSAEEIQAIAEAANQHKIKQISHLNSLRSYVESLTDLNEIKAVTYDIEIS